MADCIVNAVLVQERGTEANESNSPRQRLQKVTRRPAKVLNEKAIRESASF